MVEKARRMLRRQNHNLTEGEIVGMCQGHFRNWLRCQADYWRALAADPTFCAKKLRGRNRQLMELRGASPEQDCHQFAHESDETAYGGVLEAIVDSLIRPDERDTRRGQAVDFIKLWQEDGKDYGMYLALKSSSAAFNSSSAAWQKLKLQNLGSRRLAVIGCTRASARLGEGSTKIKKIRGGVRLVGSPFWDFVSGHPNMSDAISRAARGSELDDDKLRLWESHDAFVAVAKEVYR